MTAKEKAEHEKLQRRWACQRATGKQIARCMELDRKAAAERAQAQGAVLALQADALLDPLVQKVCAIVDRNREKQASR